MLVNCVAYQEGTKLSDIAKEDISEYVKRPIVSSGSAEGPNAGRARGNARGIRLARAGRRRRSPRPPAAEDRRVRKLIVRCTANGRDQGSRASRQRSRHLRRPNY